MADDNFWTNGKASADRMSKTYGEMTPEGVARETLYQSVPFNTRSARAKVVKSERPAPLFASIKKKMSHPSSRFAAPRGPALKMRNPRVPYKSTGFMARPSKSMLVGASRLPQRTVTSLTAMPANFCYTAADVTAVRDQGSCGSCWAVSATSMMADRAYVTSQGRIRCALSAQQLMECSDYSDGGTPVGCEGNDPFTALKTIKEHPVYVVEEKEYPRQYTATPSSASNCLPGTEVKSYAVSASEAFMLTEPIPSNASETEKDAIIKRNVENMKQSLYNEGPLVVVFNVPDDFKDYDGLSIYEPPENFDTTKVNNWHAVELIGWRTEPSTKQQYWVCRNSWGSGWPSNHRPGAGMGEFYMAMNKNACAIEEYAVGIIPRLINQSKARNTPDNRFPGESGYSVTKFGGEWSGWAKTVLAVAIVGAGIYAYKKYYVKK